MYLMQRLGRKSSDGGKGKQERLAPGKSKSQSTPPTDGDDQFTEEQMFHFKGSFSYFDMDGDETVTPMEFGMIMRSSGQNPTEVELTDIFNLVDADGSGTLEFPEFCILMAAKMKERESAGEDKEGFLTFDKDMNGFITANELAYVVTNLGGGRVTPPEAAEMLREDDIDGDGQISYDEYRKMVLRNSHRSF
jgi:calmodulin